MSIQKVMDFYFIFKKKWPTTAAIQVRDLMVSFTNSETDAILKHISFNIFSGEKIALVGRAGAEKIALISCLFRFMEPMRGSIKIDGVNIAWVNFTYEKKTYILISFFLFV